MNRGIPDTPVPDICITFESIDRHRGIAYSIRALMIKGYVSPVVNRSTERFPDYNKIITCSNKFYATEGAIEF